jgi:hypothetical protein
MSKCITQEEIPLWPKALHEVHGHWSERIHDRTGNWCGMGGLSGLRISSNFVVHAQNVSSWDLYARHKDCCQSCLCSRWITVAKFADEAKY